MFSDFGINAKEKSNGIQRVVPIVLLRRKGCSKGPFPTNSMEEVFHNQGKEIKSVQSDLFDRAPNCAVQNNRLVIRQAFKPSQCVRENIKSIQRKGGRGERGQEKCQILERFGYDYESEDFLENQVREAAFEDLVISIQKKMESRPNSLSNGLYADFVKFGELQRSEIRLSFNPNQELPLELGSLDDDKGVLHISLGRHFLEQYISSPQMTMGELLSLYDLKDHGAGARGRLSRVNLRTNQRIARRGIISDDSRSWDNQKIGPVEKWPGSYLESVTKLDHRVNNLLNQKEKDLRELNGLINAIEQASKRFYRQVDIEASPLSDFPLHQKKSVDTDRYRLLERSRHFIELSEIWIKDLKKYANQHNMRPKKLETLGTLFQKLYQQGYRINQKMIRDNKVSQKIFDQPKLSKRDSDLLKISRARWLNERNDIITVGLSCRKAIFEKPNGRPSKVSD